MKKTAIFSVALLAGLAIFAGDTAAYTAPDANVPNVLSKRVQRNNQQRYMDALRARYSRQWKTSVTAKSGYYNIKNQKFRHLISQQEAAVDDGSSDMKRTGELTDYSGVRPAARARVQRVNAKQTFRARAIDYYVEGGDANAEAMAAGVIDGETNKVSLRRSRNMTDAVGAAILPARDAMRWGAAAPEAQEGTKVKPSTFRRGNYYRNFRSPYIKMPE